MNGVDYNHIVNNTGIPTSEWGKYKAAGTKTTTVDFAALAKAAADGQGDELKDIISKLSDKSKATLRRLKYNPNFISKREWMDLTHELNEMGVLSDDDYNRASPMFIMVPLGDMDNPYTLTNDMRATLDQLNQWPANPFEYLDMWAFSLRKWTAALSMERNSIGTPKYQNFSPIQQQASACDRVSGLVKALTRAL